MTQANGTLLLRQLRKLVTTRRPGAQLDRQLLQQFLADGDQAAFTALVERHGAMVLGVCRSVLGHQQDAEDAFQATFLVLARQASAIKKQESVSSWLHGVAYRLALKAKSQAGQRRSKEKAASTPDAQGPLEDLTVRELQAILHEELHRLPEKYRAPLLLCYWEGMTRDEAAAELGWKRGTFKELLERARNLLRSRLLRRGFVPSAALFTGLLSQMTANAAVSLRLIESTTQASLRFAAGNSAGIPAAAALAKGAIRTMQLKKWALLAVMLCVLGTFGGGLGALALSDGEAQAELFVQENPKDVKNEAQQPMLPKIEWHGHNKGLPRSELPIEVTPGAKIERTKTGLVLPVKIVSKSLEPIVLQIPLAPRGGTWPTTDLYASVTKRPKGDEVEAAPFRIVYQFDDREPGAPEPIILHPGKNLAGRALDIKVRLDWSGTGSIPNEPHLNPGDAGTFDVRLALVFEVSKKRQYVIGPSVGVELPADEPLPKISDAGADAWFKMNADKFALTLTGGGAMGIANVHFATNPIREAGGRKDGFKLTNAEAGAIVQTLVDTGMWGRSDMLPGIPFPGRYLHLSSYVWRLGMIDEDVTSRIIIQHLLKLGGEREQAVREWLAFRVKQQAPQPKDVPPVRQINLGTFRKALGSTFVIRDEAELKKTIDDAEVANRIGKEVDFKKERLIGFSWMGSSDSKMTWKIEGDKERQVIFRLVPGKAKNKAQHTVLFAVAKEVSFAGERESPAAEKKGEEPKAREIDLKGFKLEKPQGDIKKPIKISDSKELVGTFLGLFADKAWPGKIMPQVDFEKEYLLLFTWGGSSGDKLSVIPVAATESRVAIFRYVPGESNDLRSHVRLFAVPIGMTWRMAAEDGPPGVQGTSAMREIKLEGELPKIDFYTREPVPMRIKDAKALKERSDDKAQCDRILNQVDFDTEHLLFFAWSSGSGEKLTLKAGERMRVPLAEFHYAASANDAKSRYIRLFVIPFNAEYTIVPVKD